MLVTTLIAGVTNAQWGAIHEPPKTACGNHYVEGGPTDDMGNECAAMHLRDDEMTMVKA